jgi:hypothetical protein
VAPRIVRSAERAILGVIMTVIAVLAERRVRKAIRKK